MKVYLSPSSQTYNQYADGEHNEAQICRKIAEKVYALLITKCEVRLADAALSVNGRINDSNKWGSELHVCIHSNAGGGHGANGYCYDAKNPPEQLIYCYDNLNRVNINKGGGIHKAKFAEILNTRAACVYLEIEFHDNLTDALYIVNHTEEYARAIAAGILCEDLSNMLVPTNRLYKVQVGAYAVKDNAEKTLEALKNAGFSDAYIKQE